MTMLFSTKQVIRPSELTVWPKTTIWACRSLLALLGMLDTRLGRRLERVLEVEWRLEWRLELRVNGKSEATAEVISASVPNALNSTKGIPETYCTLQKKKSESGAAWQRNPAACHATQKLQNFKQSLASFLAELDSFLQ